MSPFNSLFASVVHTCGIPSEYYRSFFEAMRFDAQPRRFADLEDLIEPTSTAARRIVLIDPFVVEIPLVMSAAWMILVGYVKVMLARRAWPAWIDVIVASLWMTAIDFVIDPVAAGPLKYWSWVNTGAYYGIPASNFLGWFLVSAVIFIVLRVAPGRWADNVWTRRIGLSIVVFFTVIAAAYELWLAVAVGALLVCLDVATSHVLRTETRCLPAH
ncbi:MAG: carotenoid biosynthesis protein [Acidobacteriota bacterium]|nr:carotenoid biosynthesis protein [Acidobacteriota bacterium]